MQTSKHTFEHASDNFIVKAGPDLRLAGELQRIRRGVGLLEQLHLLQLGTAMLMRGDYPQGSG